MSTTLPIETNNGRVTSWLPLTTGWSSVTDCSDIFILHNTETKSSLPPWPNPPPNPRDIFHPLKPSPDGDTWVAFDPSQLLPPKCLPDEVMTWWNQTDTEKLKSTVISLSPLTCPEAWSTAATFVKSGISTQVMCCPPGYFLSNSAAFSTGVDGTCVSHVSSGATLTYGWSTSKSETGDFLMETTLESDLTVQAIPIVGWNLQQTAFLTSNPTTGQINPKAVTSFPTQTRSSSTASGSFSVENSTDDNSKSGGLSDGAKAGIGVTAAVIIFLIIILITWIVILKRRGSAKMKINDESTEPSHSLDADDDLKSNQPPELGDSQRINEINHTNVFELDPASASVELTATSPNV